MSQKTSYRGVLENTLTSVTQDLARREKLLKGGMTALQNMLKRKTDDWQKQAREIMDHARYQALFDEADAEALLDYLKRKEAAIKFKEK